MSRRNNQNNQYNGNQYNGNQYYGNQYYGNGNGNNNQYYNQNGQYYNQNGQYYNQNNGQYYNQDPNKNNKFGIYNQSNQGQQNKNNSNFGLYLKIGLFVLFAVILIIVVFSINSCGKKEKEEEVLCAEDYMQVGTDKYGYYCIPSDWVNFKDKNLVRGIQYSDINGEYILTLDAVTTSEISAQEYALATANNLQNAGIPVQGAESKVGKYDAYQVYGQANNGVWVLVQFFEGDDGYTHYVGVEGPDRSNEAFKIADTFTIKNKES